jgi:hypothetical protein
MSLTSNMGMCTASGIAPFISISKDWRISISVASPKRHISSADGSEISTMESSCGEDVCSAFIRDSPVLDSTTEFCRFNPIVTPYATGPCCSRITCGRRACSSPCPNPSDRFSIRCRQLCTRTPMEKLRESPNSIVSQAPTCHAGLEQYTVRRRVFWRCGGDDEVQPMDIGTVLNEAPEHFGRHALAPMCPQVGVFDFGLRPIARMHETTETDDTGHRLLFNCKHAIAPPGVIGLGYRHPPLACLPCDGLTIIHPAHGLRITINCKNSVNIRSAPSANHQALGTEDSLRHGPYSKVSKTESSRWTYWSRNAASMKLASKLLRASW